MGKICKWVPLTPSALFLDSLSIDPSSIEVPNLPDSLIDIQYDLSTGKIMVASKIDMDSVQICYRALPFTFHQTWQNRTLDQYDSNALFKAPILNAPQFQIVREELFPGEGLTKTGSISRSVSFGNNQSVFVNGQLNLQLDGKITDDLYIRAVITDQNIPFQPEGNTIQLQEFDRVFLQIYNEKISLTAGDTRRPAVGCVAGTASDTGIRSVHFVRDARQQSTEACVAVSTADDQIVRPGIMAQSARRKAACCPHGKHLVRVALETQCADSAL